MNFNSQHACCGLIHVYQKSYSFKGTKSLGGGGQLSHQVFSKEGCLRIQKNLGSRLLNLRNTILHPFWCGRAFLLIFYMGKYGKTSKNAHFGVLSPLNGVFCANFIPYPMGRDARDFLSQFWNIEIFALWNGGSSKMRKIAIFDHFRGQNCIFSQL